MVDPRQLPAPPADSRSADALVSFGPRLRSLRTERGIGLREFARRLGVSASAVSQMETGKIRPTMKRLHDIVAELGIGLEDVFDPTPSPATGRPPGAPGATRGSATGPGADLVDFAAGLLGGRFAGAGDHPRLLLEDGVEWYRISPVPLPGLELLRTVYPIGARVSPESEFVQHGGWELGYVLSGRMRVQLGFEVRDVGPGESICFDSAVPHKLSNPFDQAAEAVWLRSVRPLVP